MNNYLCTFCSEQFGGAEPEEEEKFLAVKEYLHLEIKLSRKTIDQMEIERIFAPARDNPEWLYVTFKYESSVYKIFEKTRIMRKESRILTYIPKQYRKRFEAILDLGNIIRLARWGTWTSICTRRTGI